MTKYLFCVIIGLLLFLYMPKDNSQEIQELQNTVQQLQRDLSLADDKVIELKNTPIRLDRYLDNDSKKIIEDIIDDELFEMQWRASVHYLSFFESLDALTQTVTGASTIAYSGGKDAVILTTGAVATNYAQITKTASRQGLITFSQDSRFRTAFDTSIGGGSLSNATIYMVIGDTTGEYYGFKITGGSLYGVTKRTGVAEATATLQAYTEASAILNIEARYYANARVDFFVNSVQVGSISNSSSLVLPTVSTTTNSALLDFKITTSDAFTKSLYVSFFEYFQRRNILKF